MEKPSNKLIAVATLLVLAVAGSIMNSHQSMAQGANGPIVSIDPTQLPLQVTGSTMVSGSVAATQSGPWTVGVSGAVGATQSGQWNVGLTGTPTVNVVNPANIDLPFGQSILGGSKATLVMNVNEARQPVQRSFVGGFDAGGKFGSNPPTYLVPPGKRLVIEWVSAEFTVGNFFPKGLPRFTVFVTTKVGNEIVSHVLPYSPLVDVDGSISTAEQVRLYADEQTSVNFLAKRTTVGDVVGFAPVYTISFSGYLVDTNINLRP